MLSARLQTLKSVSKCVYTTTSFIIIAWDEFGLQLDRFRFKMVSSEGQQPITIDVGFTLFCFTGGGSMHR